MTNNLTLINFTYSSPHEDLTTSLNIENTGKINIKKTLLNMHDKLLYNVNIIDVLLQNVESIDDIIPLSFDEIGIKINSIETMEQLSKENIIKVDVQLSKKYEEYEEYSEYEKLSPETMEYIASCKNETHNYKLSLSSTSDTDSSGFDIGKYNITNSSDDSLNLSEIENSE